MFGLLGWGSGSTFYRMLAEQAEAARQAAELLHRMAADFAHAPDYAQKIEQLKHDGRRMAFHLLESTASTFVTPLDKEDLECLSRALEQLPIAIQAAAWRIVLFRLPEPRPDLEPLTGLLLQVNQALADTIGRIGHAPDKLRVVELLKHMTELEIAADRLYRQALADLFNAPDADPILVMKWKEVYDWIETAVDRCLPVVRSVETILLKYA